MKLSEKIQEALREQQEINLSDPAVQKRLAAQCGYVPAGAQAQPAPSFVHSTPAPAQKENNMEFKREERYIVFKISDVVEHLTTTEALHLARLYEIQRVGRKEVGKSELECVVVEKDWPEYEPTWKAIEARVNVAQPAPSAPDGWLRAIDEALVTAHIGVANAHDTYEQAKAKLDNLIGFNINIATDPAVNGGYKLVPIEPTTEIRKAMHYAYWQNPQLPYHDGSPALWNAAYAAMLKAAPESKS